MVNRGRTECISVLPNLRFTYPLVNSINISFQEFPVCKKQLLLIILLATTYYIKQTVIFMRQIVNLIFHCYLFFQRHGKGMYKRPDQLGCFNCSWWYILTLPVLIYHSSIFTYFSNHSCQVYNKGSNVNPFLCNISFLKLYIEHHPLTGWFTLFFIIMRSWVVEMTFFMTIDYILSAIFDVKYVSMNHAWSKSQA